jgi:hypothetical protein
MTELLKLTIAKLRGDNSVVPAMMDALWDDDIRSSCHFLALSLIQKENIEGEVAALQEVAQKADKEARGWRGPGNNVKVKKEAEDKIAALTLQIKPLDKDIRLFKKYVKQWEQTRMSPEERAALLYMELIAEFNSDGGWAHLPLKNNLYVTSLY